MQVSVGELLHSIHGKITKPNEMQCYTWYHVLLITLRSYHETYHNNLQDIQTLTGYSQMPTYPTIVSIPRLSWVEQILNLKSLLCKLS